MLEQAREALIELPGAGASILEISHRSTHFLDILAEAEANLRALFGIGAEFRVLFLQGGAQQQFALIPMNFLAGSGGTAEYVVTGYWSRKACSEARLEGDSAVLWDGAEVGYRRMPRRAELCMDAARKRAAVYVHCTANETIQGIQLREAPDTGSVPLICDASSDILSRPLPMDCYRMLYASAQKNLGPAGLTLAIVHQTLLDTPAPPLHPMLDYRALAAAGSVLNTPPVFAIYTLMLMTRWVRDGIGGLDAMAHLNQRKADLLYAVLDTHPDFYRGHALPESRSLMNVTWRLPDEQLEGRFLAEAAQIGCVELRGHRSVGGIRASLYNAVTLEACQTLATFMENFIRRHG